MKIVTNDYGCGTSSSILDYGIEDVVVVSEKNYQHVFEQEDDLLFIGHDFLFYLWDNEDKLKKWMSYSQKNELWLWCFERVDAIVPAWQQKSHFSISVASKFCKRILACDEDDCDKYNFDWLPQWASKDFYIKRNSINLDQKKILFSGQAGIPEYHMRNLLLEEIRNDDELKSIITIANTKRTFSWDEYIKNFLRYKAILNPVGILRGLNTRAYEALYSGRILLQHTVGNYSRHEKMLKDNPGVIFFKNSTELKNSIKLLEDRTVDPDKSFEEHSIFSRMKKIGIDIK